MTVSFDKETEGLFDSGISEIEEKEIKEQSLNHSVTGNRPPQEDSTNSLYGTLGIPLASINENFQSLLQEMYVHIRNNRIGEAELLAKKLEDQKGFVKEHRLVIKYEIFKAYLLFRKRRFSDSELILKNLEDDFNYFNKELFFFYYLNKGRIAFTLNRYGEAYELYRHAERNIITNVNEVASLYYNLAAACAQLFELYKAIDYIEIAYRCYKQLGNVNEICRCHLLRATCYSRLKEFAKSEQYYKKAIIMAEKVNDEAMKINAFHNLAGMALNQENYDLAIEYYLKSLGLATEHGRIEFAAKTIFAVAKLYYRLGQSEKALEFVNNGIELCSINEDKPELNDVKEELLAFYYLLTNEIDKYEESLTQLVYSFSERKIWSKVLDYAELLSGFYMKLKKYEDATACLKLAYEAKRKLGKSERR